MYTLGLYLQCAVYDTSGTYVHHYTEEYCGVLCCRQMSVAWLMWGLQVLCVPLALNCSLALLNCDGYPDVCDQYNISTYPYVLLFHNSTLSPLPLTGTLDSAHLLSALGQHTPPHHHQHKAVVRGLCGNSNKPTYCSNMEIEFSYW